MEARKQEAGATLLRYDSEGMARAGDGTRLFYGVRGQGRDLAFCDGIGCDGFVWRYLQERLAAKHRTVHWHYRGHGRSGTPVDAERIDIKDHAEDFEAVLDAAGFKRGIIFGHSMGTQVALELYRRAPERVEALVLLCGSYGRITATFHGTQLLETWLPTLLDTVKRHKPLARALWGRIPKRLAYRVARMTHEIDGPMREEDFRVYLAHVAAMDIDLFLATLSRAGEHSAEDLLPEIKVPVLVIAAEHDTFTPPDLAQHMANTIPRSQFLLARGGSHGAPVEQPDFFMLAFEKFLRDMVDGGAGTTRA